MKTKDAHRVEREPHFSSTFAKNFTLFPQEIHLYGFVYIFLPFITSTTPAVGLPEQTCSVVA